MGPETLRLPYRSELELPVIGLEAEFKVFIDAVEIVPEEYWRTPAAFIDQPLLRRSSKSVQLPTGGALYFDGGVLEVVTPVIELASQCTARAVRSLWEQIGFVRDALDRWEQQHQCRVRLEGFSCHFNISFELTREERNRNRTIQKLAVLLAHILPPPVLILGANRRSSGIGVRPRRDRIEITLDFTPDPGLMAATTALIVGVVREVISWPSYLQRDAEEAGIPMLDGLEPGPHPTRKGWIARRENFPFDPFASPLDAPIWTTTDGAGASLRDIALRIALRFRESIRRFGDPFSLRLILAVLRGEVPSLLDLPDRPAAYGDVGRTTRWGSVLPELHNFAATMRDAESDEPRRRASDVAEKLAAPWDGEPGDRRRSSRGGRRTLEPQPPAPKRLSRSAYERVFILLGASKPFLVGGEILTPIAVRGWYHVLFADSSGAERLVSIDQLVRPLEGKVAAYGKKM